MRRRIFGLTQQPSQGFSAEDRRWLATQGIARPEQLPRKSLWYHPDGRSSIAPSDPYHLGLYRQRGLTLVPPAPPEHQPRRVPVPSIARQVVSLLGQDQRWEGSPSELADQCGMSPVAVSKALAAPKVTAALGAVGVTASRGYRGKGRVLRLERR
jgi:hypothetical protein